MTELQLTILWIAIAVVALGLIILVLSWFIASYSVYVLTLRRGSAKRWSRDVPSDLNEESVAMYETGLKWAAEHQDKKVDVHIVRDGLNLYGEYYDFGYNRAAVILSGRTESLRYGYYFAIPYSRLGFNILVFDPRAHGLSDGNYNTVGFEESKDTAAWVKHIVDNFGVKSVILHGICIGGAGGILSLTANGEHAPEISGIVTEGLFANFKESVKNHMIERNKPTFVTLNLIDRWMVHFTGHTMSIGPINYIEKLDVPLLMLHSKEDAYSKPEFAEKLYQTAGGENKSLVWFDHGRHSMLRITNTELYDRSIEEFVDRIYSER